MQKRASVILDAAGQPMSSVTITVKLAATGTLATIYSDNGVTTKANPFINDANGSFEYYAANGRYDETLAKTGVTFDATNTSDLLHWDPGALGTEPLEALVKGWVYCDSNGNILDSFNVTSVTDNGTGDWTVNWATPFSSVQYVVHAEARYDAGGTAATTFVMSVAETGTTASATRVLCSRVSDGALVNPNHISVTAFGSQ